MKNKKTVPTNIIDMYDTAKSNPQSKNPINAYPKNTSKIILKLLVNSILLVTSNINVVINVAIIKITKGII